MVRAVATGRDMVVCRSLAEFLDPRLLLGRDHRPAIEVEIVRADLQLAEARGQRRHETCRRSIRCTRTSAYPPSRSGRRSDDGVGDHSAALAWSASSEDDLRRFSPQFQHAGHVMDCRACCTSVPTSGEPVNEMKSTSGWASECRAGLLAKPCDDVDDARRKAGLDSQFGQPHPPTGRPPPPASSPRHSRRPAEAPSVRTETSGRVVPRNDHGR